MGRGQCRPQGAQHRQTVQHVANGALPHDQNPGPVEFGHVLVEKLESPGWENGHVAAA